MNFIVARMSQVLDIEEQGFWVFTQLMESLLPINHYTQMIGVQIDVRVSLGALKSTCRSCGLILIDTNLTLCSSL